MRLGCLPHARRGRDDGARQCGIGADQYRRDRPGSSATRRAACCSGVTVVIEHTDTGVRVERQTDQEGRYLAPSLRIGTHTLTATLAGFAPLMRQRVNVGLGQRLLVDLVLQIGGVSEQIAVTSDTSLLQTASAEISDIISGRQVIEVPLNGRNFLALAQLSDGVVLPPGGTRGEALQQAGPLPNVGGQRSGRNIYLLDGVKVTDELFNNLGVMRNVLPPPSDFRKRQMTSVGLDGALGDRQPQTRSGNGVIVAPVEPIEDSRLPVFRDAGA